MSESHHTPAGAISSGLAHKTLSAYLAGFVFSLIITIAAFLLVAYHHELGVSNVFTYIALAILALAQLYVQVVYFLGLNTGPEARWNLMSFSFVLLIVAVLVGGSLWIMINLNYNMMH